MEQTIHLKVVESPAGLREIHVPPGGVRIGRSSRNDLSIPDEAMSRFQCRFFFKHGGELWVSDLGSANGTLVNGKTAQEQQLRLKDEVLAGDTRFVVVNEGDSQIQTASAPVPAEVPTAPSVVEPVVDLGLHPGEVRKPSGPMTPIRRILLGIAGGMLLIVLLVMLPWAKLAALWKGPPPPPSAPLEILPDLDVAFERVEGASSNIFRYALEIRNSVLKVEVDDLLSNRHVRREKKVAPELLRDLARALSISGMFDLRENYSGSAPGIFESSDLRVTLGAGTHRVKVVNQVEPDLFAAARVIVEEFGKNELGLAALAIDPATLVEKARASLLQGKKMWDEREVRDGNLFQAIRAYKECEWYLETIDPKPGFYAEALASRTDCERELQRRYDDLWFMAERAVKLRDWKEAEHQLKTICEMIPDVSDDRYRNAEKKNVDVGRHLATEQ